MDLLAAPALPPGARGSGPAHEWFPAGLHALATLRHDFPLAICRAYLLALRDEDQGQPSRVPQSPDAGGSGQKPRYAQRGTVYIPQPSGQVFDVTPNSAALFFGDQAPEMAEILKRHREKPTGNRYERIRLERDPEIQARLEETVRPLLENLTWLPANELVKCWRDGQPIRFPAACLQIGDRFGDAQGAFVVIGVERHGSNVAVKWTRLAPTAGVDPAKPGGDTTAAVEASSVGA